MAGKEKEISNLSSIKNNIFAMKMGWKLSKSRMIHELIVSMLNHFEWIFYSAVFIRFIISAIEKQKSFREILTFILICCGVFVSISLYRNYADNVSFALTNTKIYQGLYQKLYEKARNVELSCYETPEFYNKYTMAIDGAGDKITNVIRNIWGIITGMIATIVVFYAIYEIDRWAILFIIFPILGNFVFSGAMNRLHYKRYQDNIPNERVVQYVNRVMYLAEYAKEMRLSNVYRLVKEKYNASVKGTVNIAEKYSIKLVIFNFLKNTFTFIIIFEGVLLYAAYKAMVIKSMSLAELAIIFSIMVSATWILIGLFNSLVEMMKNGLFVNNLRTFMEYQEVIPEDQDGLIPEPVISLIEFRNVCFSYKEKKNIIHNLSFRIEGNHKVAFVGHNGAGKSTIIKLLFRLYDPTEGEILVNGRNIKEYNLRAYRALFAAAFQDYKVLALSVKDNVLMGRTYENEDKVVAEALRMAGVYEKVKSMPNGIHTILTKEFDEDGAILSGGQYQKIVVARAFAQNTPIKVFDEPSSALDPIAEYDLYQSIIEDSKNKTMIFISHRLSSVRNADKVFMLEQGKLIEEGTHVELMMRKGAYADMYTKQALNYLALDNAEGVIL